MSARKRCWVAVQLPAEIRLHRLYSLDRKRTQRWLWRATVLGFHCLPDPMPYKSRAAAVRAAKAHLQALSKQLIADAGRQASGGSRKQVGLRPRKFPGSVSRYAKQ
ncbi:MAG: hypothetical protein E6Q97_23520 [Desulfurellales bacterium]|nr:MAG: hypothetical protein E6Q97_23520 [Desulfurellales bacterium]